MCCNDTNITSLTSVFEKYLGKDSCPDPIMSPQSFHAFDRALSCGIVPSLFLVGAPSNILSMIIFHRQGLRDRMNLCLFCLAFIDLMYVTVIFLNGSVCFLGFFLPEQQSLLLRLSIINYTLNFNFGFTYSSGCLTMIIAVERCVCVVFPMKAAKLISTKTMAMILSLTLLLMQALCAVYAVKQKIQEVKSNVTGEYFFISVYTDLYLTYSFFGIIENIVLSCVSFFIFGCVLLSTLITVTRLHAAQTWRRSTSLHVKGQGMLMRMLVAMSCVYILCTAPNVALALTRFTVPEFRVDGPYCNIFSCLHMVGKGVFLFNSSTNFFVYATMSSRFREELKSLFSSIKTRWLLNPASTPAK